MRTYGKIIWILCLPISANLNIYFLMFERFYFIIQGYVFQGIYLYDSNGNSRQILTSSQFSGSSFTDSIASFDLLKGPDGILYQKVHKGECHWYQFFWNMEINLAYVWFTKHPLPELPEVTLVQLLVFVLQ